MASASTNTESLAARAPELFGENSLGGTTGLLKCSQRFNQNIEKNLACLKKKNGTASVPSGTAQSAIEIEENKMAQFVKQSTEKQAALKKKIADAEEVYAKLLQENENKLEELKKIEYDEAEKVASFDTQIEDLQTEFANLQAAGQDDKEYVDVVGVILTKLKLDSKSTVGQVKCPAGHVIITSTSALETETNNNQEQAHANSGGGQGSEAVTCDFWNCPALNLSL